MALNINTSRLNDALRQMASFFMQNKLGELSQQRQMDTYSEQDRLMRERSAAEDVQSRKTKDYESKINVEEYIKKAFIDTAKSNDAYDYNVRAGQVAKEAGDLARSKEYYGKAYELAVPNLTAKMNALKGKVDEKDFLATMEAFGEDGVEKIMSEAGTNARANQQLPIQQSQARTSAGNLALQQTKAKQSETGEVPQDEYYKIWHSKIEGVKKVILGFKEAYASPDTTPQERMDIAQILSQVEVKPTEFLKTLSDLNRIDTKAITKRLTPNDEAWLDKFGGFAENNPIPEEPIPSRFGASGYPRTGPTAQVAPPPIAPPPVVPTQDVIPAEVQAYMLKHPELSLDFVMKKYQEYMRLKGAE
jgi:hypothetical protein